MRRRSSKCGSCQLTAACLAPGELKRDFKHLAVDMHVFTDEDGAKQLRVDCHFGKRKTLAVLRTTTSHVEVRAVLHPHSLLAAQAARGGPGLTGTQHKQGTYRTTTRFRLAGLPCEHPSLLDGPMCRDWPATCPHGRRTLTARPDACPALRRT